MVRASQLAGRAARNSAILGARTLRKSEKREHVGARVRHPTAQQRPGGLAKGPVGISGGADADLGRGEEGGRRHQALKGVAQENGCR